MNALRTFVLARAGWGIFFVVLIVTGWPALLADSHELMVSFTDDTFYYFTVARHVARGQGFTFDGLHPTNGFQPLWLFTLVPIFRLFPGDLPPVRVAMALQSILIGAGAALLWRVLRSRLTPATAAAVPLLLIALPGASALWLGMESSLFFLMLVATWAAWLRIEVAETPSTRDWALVGTCCALLFLARIEGGVALPILLLLGFRRLRSTPRPIAACASFVGPAALICSAYLIWNQLAFGTWLPISGTVKMQWVSRAAPGARLWSLLDVPWIGRFLLERFFGIRLPAWAIAASALTILGAVVAALIHREAVVRALREANAAFIVLACGAVALLDHVVVGPYLGEWAFVPSQLLTAIAIGLVSSRIRRAGTSLLVLCLLLCAARVPVHARMAERWAHSFMGRSLVLAEWIRDNTPPEARVATGFAGVVGYFSGRTVINLDGLVNSRDYYKRVLVGDEWESYLCEEGVDLLMHVGCVDHQPIVGMLDYFGKKTERPDRYAFNHLVRDPDRPEGCGLLLFDVVWEDEESGRERCPGAA